MEETPSVLVLSTHGVIYLFVSDIFFFDQLSLMFHKCIHLEQLQLIWVISWLHPFIQIDSLFYLLGQIPLVLALLYWDCHLIFKRIFFFFFQNILFGFPDLLLEFFSTNIFDCTLESYISHKCIIFLCLKSE